MHKRWKLMPAGEGEGFWSFCIVYKQWKPRPAGEGPGFWSWWIV